MRKFSILIAFALILSACASNTSQPNSNADQVATVVAATLTALPPTEIPATQPVDVSSMNGQLQGTLAFIRNNNLWINVNGIESQLTNDADPSSAEIRKLWYSNPQISPDGAQVAYLKNTYDASTFADTRSLVISGINGENARQLANDVAWTLPIVEWSNDSQNIYYASAIDTLENMIVKSINLATGAQQEYGQFLVQSGCGGGSSDPADAISSNENLEPFGGAVFELSPQNNYIVHTVSCSGSGLGVLDLSTKQDRVLDENARGAVISPDGSSIAAILDSNIVVFNVNAGGVDGPFPTSETPQALLWYADGKEILYSTSRLANTVTLDDNVALDLLGSSPASFNLNLSTLWAFSMENKQSRKIIEIDAHNLKPIASEGQRVLVVMVENASKLFDYVSQGNKDNLADYYPTVNILEIDLANLISNPITNDTQQASFFK